jgi:alkaline phosphatase D
MIVHLTNPFLKTKILILIASLIPFALQSKDRISRHSIQIAFGSCLDQNLDKKIWEPILKSNPNLWIWLGDNIYKDTINIAEKKEAYEIQKADSNYTELRKKTKVLGVWDDHDFGYNDVGNEYPLKSESKDLFLEFLDIPFNAPIRKREGTYSSETITINKKLIKIILLDTRTFRTALKEIRDETTGQKSYAPTTNEEDTILGETQWKWLESELKAQTDLFLIVSSIQVLNDTHRFEKWSNFPNERAKLLSLLSKYAKGKNLILSGDRHIAEIFEEESESNGLIVDITSSSMNKPIPMRAPNEEDRRRKSAVYTQENFGLLDISVSKSKIKVDVSINGLNERAFNKVYYFKIKK